MSNGLFSPYRKPNNVTNYVHSKSNHPQSILKNIPLSVNRILSAVYHKTEKWSMQLLLLTRKPLKELDISTNLSLQKMLLIMMERGKENKNGTSPSSTLPLILM